jgi:alpha-2-macroglobulin
MSTSQRVTNHRAHPSGVRWRSGALALVAAVLVGACTTSSKPEATSPTTDAPRATDAPKSTKPPVIPGESQLPQGDVPRLFEVKLTKGVLPDNTSKAAAVAAGEAIEAARITEFVAKLPKWEDLAALTTPFNWPVQSPPPPRTGETITEKFPPDSSITPPPSSVGDPGPLKVLRVQPEGEVPLAPYLAVTFNQPMVGVGTVSQVNASDVPVKLEPAIAGRWQWIGTRTLRFDADATTVDRLPMATTFTATIPAGTKSATGQTLATAATFTFGTPAPTVVSFAPGYMPSQDIDIRGQGIETDSVFVAVFDQRIDQAQVLNAIKLTAAGAATTIRVATKSEIDNDVLAKSITENAEPGRWIAFRAVNNLPKDTALSIAVGPGVPSAEGSRTSTQAATYIARTYAPLKVERFSCAFGDNQCPPGSELFIEFNNALDTKVATNATAPIAITPAIPAQRVTVTANVTIQGATQGRTEYKITLPSSLTDVFGQTLGKDETVSINIGSARPSIYQFDEVTTLDPFTKEQKLSVLSTNRNELRVRVFEAKPAAFSDYLAYQNQRDDPDARQPNWKVLSDNVVKPEGNKDATIETLIDLSSELGGKPGQVIVLVEPVPAVARSADNYYENRPALTWVQSTSMAIDSFAGGEEMRAWATDLRTGAPMSGVAITASSGGASTTNNNGLAIVPIASGNTVEYLRATKGDETFILVGGWTGNVAFDSTTWYAFDDRQMYRPGESINVKGWVRNINGKTGALDFPSSQNATYVISDAFGVELAKGTAKLSALGGFDFTTALPATANIGQANIQFSLDGGGGSGSHGFQIAEFRRPEFEVTVEPITSLPFVSTRTVTMATQASYLAGGPLPNAPVAWVVSTTETNFSPVGWDAFTFGIFRPWWFRDDVFFDRAEGFGRSFPGTPTEVKQYAGTTDANGRHGLQLNFEGKDGVLPDLPVSVAVAGTVTDVNRQAWADSQSILVHSANRYVGLRSDRAFVKQGDALNVESIVTDVDGKALSGSGISVIAGLVQSNFKNGEYVEVITDPQTCKVTSEAKPTTCEFKTPVGGQYKITSIVTDESGGRNRSELTVWVSGAESQPARTVDRETLTVVPDKKEYRPGDTAKVLVQAPFAKGEGLAVVTHREGVRETTSFSATNGSAEIAIAISEADVPNLDVTIEFVGAADRVGFDGKKVDGAPQRPAYAVGALTLAVPPLSRTLKVTATPATKELEPGGKTSIAVTVADSGGAPVKDAEFAVVVVDEAILGLTDYQLPNPIDLFYANSYSPLTGRYGRDQVRLLDSQLLANASLPVEQRAGGGPGASGNAEFAAETEAAAAAPGAADATSKPLMRAKLKQVSPPGAPAPTVRSNFDALALFAPNVRTDASGKASIEVTVPDNLTRYRVMVVAASGKERFGTVESNITARLPLAIRPSAPRFLNTGDEFELPVVVQNISTASMTVDVILQTANLDLPGTTAPSASEGNVTGRRVTVPANDRIEVRFPAKVKAAGQAKFRASVFGVTSSDSAEISIPVYTPGTAEAFATYGTLDAPGSAIRQPLIAPKDVFDVYGGLEISTSSTSLQALTDALLYIDNYDYDYSDAYASRILSIGALRKLLKDFATADLPSEAALNGAVERDLEKLVALQNDDGGWSYWRRFDESVPYNSLHATHALVVAKSAGYAVKATSLERALQFAANIEQSIPSIYSQEERDALRAYAIWIRALAGQRDPSKAAALFSERGNKLNLDSLAWLWGSIDDGGVRATIERTITNRAVDTAGAVSFTSGYQDGAYLTLSSDRRTDAIVLDSLISNAPKSDLVEKVVAGLLANKTKGRWDNMQENAFALLAFKKYYDTYENVTPDFVARAWIGERFAGEHAFKGRETDRSVINVPMKSLIESGNSDLVVAKDGSGRLYYRIGLRYVPVDLKLDALDRGFVVKRTYEAVDNKADVTQDADGTWKVKAGAKVRIRLTMIAESQRTHVALVDPLPAGLEALNPYLANTEPVVPNQDLQPAPGAVSRKAWWWGPWYDFQQFRDDRSEAFTTYLSSGVYEYSYIARATTPGSFVVPPARAEEMYAPETFGRTATDRVMVVSP